MSRRSRGVTINAHITPFRDPPPNVTDVVRAVMRTAGDFAKALWIQRAQDLGIRGKGGYIQGIQDAQIVIDRDELNGDTMVVSFVLTNNAPHASIIEDGHNAFHLPSRINWSGPRVKQGKNGPYLHIPFTHAAHQSGEELARSGATMATRKSMMPADVYAKAQKLERTITDQWRTTMRGGVVGPTYVRLGQKRGSHRLSDHRTGVVAHPEGLALHSRTSPMTVGLDSRGGELTNPAWQGSRFHGMFKTGRKGHSKYMTIRTITPDSAGWNIPARQGHGIARQVSRAMSSGSGGDRFRELLVQSAQRALGFGP